MLIPAYPYSKGGYIKYCEVTIKVSGNDLFWHCATCGTQGEPTDIISAYLESLVHVKEREEND